MSLNVENQEKLLEGGSLDEVLKNLQGLAIHSEISDGDRAEITKWMNHYINVCRTCLAPSDLKSTKGELARLRARHTLYESAVKEQLATRFACINAMRETRDLLVRLREICAIEAETHIPNEGEVISLKKEVYELLREICQVSDERIVNDMALSEGVVDLIVQDLKDYQTIYIHDPIIFRLVLHGLITIHNCKQNKTGERNMILRDKAKAVLRLFCDPLKNDPEILTISLQLLDTLEPGALEIQLYPAELINRWADALAKSEFRNARYLVDMGKNKHTLGGVLECLAIISRFEANECLIIQAFEKRIASLRKLAEKGLQRSSFTTFLENLCRHACGKQTCNTMALMQILESQGVDVTRYYCNINLANTRSLLRLAEKFKTRDACFELGVHLEMDVDKVGELLKKYDDSEMKVAAVCILKWWRESSECLCDDDKKRKLADATRIVAVKNIPSASGNAGGGLVGITSPKTKTDTSAQPTKPPASQQQSVEYQVTGLSEEEQLALAIEMSLEEYQ